MQNKIKIIFALLVAMILSFAIISCTPAGESIFESQSLNSPQSEQTSQNSPQSESQNSPQSGESVAQSESQSKPQESFSSNLESSFESEFNSNQESSLESEFNSDEESSFEEESQSSSNESSSNENSPEESSSEVEDLPKESESQAPSDQIEITVSGWLVGVGDFCQVLYYGEPVLVSKAIADAGITLSTSKMILCAVVGDDSQKVNGNTQIDYSCQITVEEGRTFVTVIGIDQNGAQKTVHLLMPGIRTYRAGQAIADAGFDFDELYWQITRSQTTEPVTTSEYTLRDRDVLFGKILGSVRVIFDCADYGTLALGNGKNQLDYSKSSAWNNPQINTSQSVKNALKFEGWSLKKHAIGGLNGLNRITSVEQIFAQKLETVTLYPAFSINYTNLQGWFKIDGENTYLQVVEKQVYYRSQNYETSDDVKLICQGGEVYLKLRTSVDASDYTNCKLDFSTRPTEAIIRIRVDDPSGSNTYIFEGRKEFDEFLSRWDLTLRDFYHNGMPATPDQITDGEYYSAYFAYYTYP